MTEPSDIARRMVGAGLWTVGTRLATKLIDLGMLLCLARFLGPGEFGLVATAMAVLVIVEALFELPVSAALIRAPALVPGLLHTAFTLGLLRGLVVATLLIAASWPLAAFNAEPRLGPLLAVLALAPVTRSLVSPRMAEFARALDFRPDAIAELSGKAAAFVLSTLIAATTGSYWAIAAATVTAPLASTLVSHAMAPLRPRCSLAHWPAFANLVGWNFLSQLCAALNWQIDRLVLPRLAGTGAFGQYAMAKQISEIPLQAMIQPLVRPVMSALSSDGARRRSRYLRLSQAIVLVMVPVTGLPVLWAEVLVNVALGPAWASAATWLRCLALASLPALPAVLMGSLALVQNRPRWVAVRTLLELAVKVPLICWGTVRFGIPGAIAGGAVSNVVGTLAAMLIVRRLLGVGVARQSMLFWRPLLAMVPAGALLHAAAPFVLQAGSPHAMLLRAVPPGVAYLLVYAGGVLLAWRLAGCPGGLERHAIDLARRRFARRPSTPPSTPPSPSSSAPPVPRPAAFPSSPPPSDASTPGHVKHPP